MGNLHHRKEERRQAQPGKRTHKNNGRPKNGSKSPRRRVSRRVNLIILTEGLAALVAIAVFGALMTGHLSCTPTAASGGQGLQNIGPPTRGRSVPGGTLPKLTSLPGEFKLGKGATFGVIRIFPIYSTKETSIPQEYLSLAEAQEKDLVEISELEEDATVNTVKITNMADKPIYAISGDVIKGGNQDRVIAMDMVIPPGKNESVAVGVFCVERGRWSDSGSGMAFSHGGQACMNLKKCLSKGGVSQGQVWSKVGEINAKLDTQSGTDTYRRALEANSVESKLQPYIEQFTKEFEGDDKIVGFAVCVGKKVIACDIFLNPSLLNKMRDKLICSYIMGMRKRPCCCRRCANVLRSISY